MLANPDFSSSSKSFLTHILTSHFHTGCTLVIGRDALKVQKWIDCISFFMLPKQKPLAKTTIFKGINNFVADLSLQGLVIEEKIDDFDFVFESIYPTTIVDLNEMQVRQTHPYNSYNVIRTEYLKQPQDRNMWEGTTNERLFICKNSRLIEDIVNNIFTFANNSLFEREGFIKQSIDSLIKKAVVLIKYFDSLLKSLKESESQGSVSEQSSPKKEKNRNSSEIITNGNSLRVLNESFGHRRTSSSKGGHSENQSIKQKLSGTFNVNFSQGNGGENLSISGKPKLTRRSSSGNFSNQPLGGENLEKNNVPKIHGLDAQLRTRVRENLGFSEADYQVLMGIAEKLLPGFYIKVHGNTRWIEEKLIELFEQF